MDARGFGREGWSLWNLYSLQHGLFQTPTERAQLQAAVHQVFGGQPWGGCCCDELLEVLLEAGQQSYLKQQLYWDFQLLDSDHDGSLSARDAELLLAQVPQARTTGRAWQDFLRSRGPGVAWRDIEDWLFREAQLPVERGPRTGLRRDCFSEQGASAGPSSPLYRQGVRRRAEDLLGRGDSRGPAALLREEPSGVLAALERKYQVLQRKLCAEMLQAHYGPPAWASLPQNVKEAKLSELEMLVDLGLHEGSILALSSLPGAHHSVRSGAQALKSGMSVGPQCVPERTAAQALQQLQHRRQVEAAALLTQRHLLLGSSPAASFHLLHLHAQAELIQQEATFQAALLATELLVGERFWGSQPIAPEACHQELAQLRLAAGHRPELPWRETRAVPGRRMMQVLLDRLLLQQEKDRAHLVQILLTRAEPATVHERGCGRTQMIPPGAGCSREDASRALQEAISQLLKLVRERLEASRRTEVSWRDCAVAVLTGLQHEQQEELSRSIEELAGIVGGREGETGPTLYERLLAQLQEPPWMSLVRHLQAISSQEQQRTIWGSVQLDQEACPTQEQSTCELEAFTMKKKRQRGVPDAPQKESEREASGPLGLGSEVFPAQGQLQPKWEGLHPRRGPKSPDLHQIGHSHAEEVKVQGTVQTEEGMTQGQALQKQKSLPPQGPPKQRQVPEGFQREPNGVDPQDLRDPQEQNTLDAPRRQGDAQGPLGGLVPHESQKQQEIAVRLPKGQREVQVEPEVLNLQEKELPPPQEIAGTSEKKEPKTVRAGEFRGLQDSPQPQGPSQGAVLMERAPTQAQQMPASWRKLETSQHQKHRNRWGHQGGRDPEVFQDSVAPEEDQSLPQDEGIQAQQGKLSLDTLQPHGELLRRSKSLGCLEFVMPQAPLLQGLRDPETPLQLPDGGLEMPHLPRVQSREVGTLDPQTGSDHQCIPQRETEITQAAEIKKAMELEPHLSFKEKQEPLVSQKQVGPQVYPQEPQPQEWRDLKAAQPQVKQEIFQAHKDLSKEPPNPLAPEVRSSETPCHQERGVLESSQLHWALLHKSKSLEPQELSEAKSNVIWASPQIWQECRHRQDLQPQEETKVQDISQAERETLKCHSLREVLQHQKFPESDQEPIQSPEPSQKEPEASIMKERPDLQVLEAPLKETQLPSPEAEKKIEACQALGESGPLHDQEKLQRNLGRPQVTRPCAQKGPEDLSHQIDSAGKAKSLESVEVSRSQGMRQLDNLNIPGMSQGRSQDHLQNEMEQEALELQGYEGLQALQVQDQMGPEAFRLHGLERLQISMQKGLVFQEMGKPQDHSLPEKKSPEATQDQRVPELSQLQNLPHYGILWRKSKSLELRRQPSAQPQELRGLEVSCTPSQFPEMGAEALAPQECRQGVDFQSQKLRHKPQSHHPEESPLKQQDPLQVAQKGARITRPQNVKQAEGFSSEEGQGTEAYQSQEAQPQNSKAFDLRASLELQPLARKAQETTYAPGATPQKQTGFPPPQEVRSPESPPLLWRVLWQKAKSFELGKPHALPSPVLEPSLAQKKLQKELHVPQLTQEMKGTSVVQPQKEPQMDPETQKPQELRQPKSLSPQGLKEPEVPQTQAEKALQRQEERTSGIPPEALVGQSNSLSLQPREIRELETSSVQKALQRRPQTLHRQEIPQEEMVVLRHSGTFLEGEVKESQPRERESLETVQTQQAGSQKETWVPQIQEDINPESPPLLWGALGLKSKSFELRKPRVLGSQELRGSRMVQSQRRSQVEPEAHTPQGHKDPNASSPQELREAMAAQVQAEKETLQVERGLPTDDQGLQSQELGSPEIPQYEEVVPERLNARTLRERQGLLGQETQELETLQAQGIPEMKTRTSEVQQRVLKLPKDPETVVQGLEDPQALQSCGSGCLETLQGTSQTVLGPEECRSPETPPLLWRVLGLKAKSFELMKTQDVRYLESAFGAQRMSQKDMQAPQIQRRQRQQMVLPLAGPHMESESHEMLEHGGPKMHSPLELREQQDPQIQIEKETFHAQEMVLADPQAFQPSGSQDERGPQSPLYQQGLLEDSQVMQALQTQKLRELDAPEAQTRRLLLQKRRSPETPPLLWWALELAQQGMSHRELLASPQPQEMNKPLAIQLRGRLQAGSEDQKPKELMDKKIPYSQDLKEPEAPPVQMEASELTQSHKRSPPALEVQMLKEMEAFPVQECPQVERDPQGIEGFPREQKNVVPKEPNDLLQENMPEMCDSYKVTHSHVHESLEPQGKPETIHIPPTALQAQAMLENAPEDCGPSDESQALHLKEMPLANAETLEKVKQDDCPALELLEGLSKTKVLLPPGRLVGKSKSLDLRELQALKSQGLWEQESPQAQGMPEQRPKAFQVPEDLQMKPQKKNGLQAFKSHEKSGQEVLQAQGTPQLPQPQGPDAESHPLLQSPLKLESEPLDMMEPPALQTQELREVIGLHCQVSTQLDPENIALQGTMDGKPLCPQGRCEGKSCEFVMDSKRSEMQGILQRYPQMFFIQEVFQPEASLLRKSKSLEPRELSKLCAPLPQGLREPEILQTPGCAQEGPEMLQNQVLVGLENCSPHETTETAKNCLHDKGFLKNETKSAAQKEWSGLETSQPQEELGENKAGALDSQEYIHVKVQQLQGQTKLEALQPSGTPEMEHTALQIQGSLQRNPESFALESTVSRHSYILPLQQETPVKMPEILVKPGKSPTQLPLAYIETKVLPPWWALGKSKSLDLRELQAPHSLVGELDPCNLQHMSRFNICHPQTKLQGKLIEHQKSKGPMGLHSQTLPLQDLPQKDQEDPQMQKENRCEAQKTQQTDLLQVEETVRNKREYLCSQELENTKLFCSKEWKESEVQKCPPTAKEPLRIQGYLQGQSESQGLKEPQLLDPQEKKDLQSPPLLRDLLRKSKTIGPEGLKRHRVLQTWHAQSPESPHGNVTPKPGTQLLQHQELVGQESHNMQGLGNLGALQHQEITNIAEGIQDSSGHLDSQRQAHRIEMEALKDQEPLHVNQDFPQEQGHVPRVAPQASPSRPLPPHDVPQFGIGLLQELGRLHNELEALGSGELKDGIFFLHPQENTGLREPEQQVATELRGTMGPQMPLHQEWRGAKSDQPPPIDQKVSESHERQQGRWQQQQRTLPPPQTRQKAHGPCQTPGLWKRESGRSMGSPTLKAPRVIQPQEYLPETSPMAPGVIGPHVLQFQETMGPKGICLQASPQVGRGTLTAGGKVMERGRGPRPSHSLHPFKLQGALWMKSKSLEPQELSRTQDFLCQGPRRAAGPHSQDKKLAFQQTPSPEEPLHSHPQALKSQVTSPKNQEALKEQEMTDTDILLPPNRREPKAQEVGKHFQGKQEMSHLPELRHQKIPRKVVIPGLQWLEEPQAVPNQEWRETETSSGEGSQPRMLSTPGVGQLNQDNREPAALIRRLEASPSWEEEEEETTESGKRTAMTARSPPSPGSHGQEPMWEPTSLSVGTSRETSICVAPPGTASGLSSDDNVSRGFTGTENTLSWEKEAACSQADEPNEMMPSCSHHVGADEGAGQPQRPLQEDMQADGETEHPRTWQPPPPRPPSQEKAFIWLSCQEKEEALRRLTELQAEGERRHQRDKERQTLRFQEKLSIARHRKSEEDLWGASPAERWPLPAAHLGQQDQAGQKAAVKQHLEKVKRERTYVMQSKRERNTLRFKELLSPLAACGEEHPEAGPLGDA